MNSRRLRFVAGPLFALGAQTALPASTLNDARRAAVRDLTRIVAPTGVQDSTKASIGGIDQWVDVRGQDRAFRAVDFTPVTRFFFPSRSCP